MRPFPADGLRGRGAAMAETDQTPGLGNRGRMGPVKGSVATPHSSRAPGRIRHTGVGSPAARRRLSVLESPACPTSARRLGRSLELDLRMLEHHTQLDLRAVILRQTANGSGHSQWAASTPTTFPNDVFRSISGHRQVPSMHKVLCKAAGKGGSHNKKACHLQEINT